MAFQGKKVYGDSKQDACVFCGSNARYENPQGFTVCADHKSKEMEAMRCACGDWLDIRKSKWGAFFTCTKCGPISLKKAMDVKDGNLGDGFKLNKKFRQVEIKRKAPVKYEEDVIYTLDELESMW